MPAIAPLLAAAAMVFGSGHKPGARLSDLIDLSFLASMEDGRTRQVSSYDRSGGNDDGFSGAYSYLQLDERGEHVLLDVRGPGAIVMMWFTDLRTIGDLRFTFDGEPSPRLSRPAREYFSGSFFPFIEPLVGDDEASSGGFYSYVPMPFRKGCRITTTGLARFYHVGYRTFTDAEGIETFSPDLSPEAVRSVAKKLGESLVARPLDFPAKSRAVMPGGRATLAEASGPAMVKSLHLKVGEGDAKRLVLRITFDGMETPCVEAPVLDLFGNGFDRAGCARTLPMFADDPVFACAFPMPFSKSARVEVENGGDRPIDVGVELSTSPLASAEGRPYFHARYRESRTRSGFPYEILRAEGAGHFCGVSMAMQGKGNLEFLEGDERLFVDGEGVPSFHGTGTEDFFNAGWYFNRGLFERPFHGLALKDEMRGRIAAHRYLIMDSVPFQHQIRVEIEHGGGNDYPGAFYSSVAFWYQTEPHVAAPGILASSLRVPRLAFAPPPGFVSLVGRSRKSDFTARRVRSRSWSDVSAEWEGNDQIVVEADREGDAAHFTLAAPYSDRFSLRLFHTVGPDFGIYEVSLDGKGLEGAIDGFAAEIRVNQPAGEWVVSLAAGDHDLGVRVAGRNRDSRGYGAALDYLTLRSAAPFLSDWLVIGPFPSADRSGLDVAYGPESSSDLAATFTGKDGATIGWKPARANGEGYVDLRPLFQDSEHAVAYAAVTVESPEARDAILLLGSDDSVKVFAGGREIFRRQIHRASAPDQDSVPLRLEKGANRLLIKVENDDGGFGFHARIADLRGDLRAGR